MSNRPGEPDKQIGQFWMRAGANSSLSAPLLTLGGNVKIETGDSLDVSESDLLLADDQINYDKINAGTVDTIAITELNIQNMYMSNKPGQPDKKIGQFWMKAGGNSYLSAPLLTLGGNVKIELGDSLDVSESDLILADDQISGDKINAGTIGTITINELNSNTINVDNINNKTITIDNIYMSNRPGEPDKKVGQFWMKAGGNSYLSAPLLTLGSNVKTEYGGSLDVSESDLILADDQISGYKINAGTIDTITITELNNTNATIHNDLNIKYLYE